MATMADNTCAPTGLQPRLCPRGSPGPAQSAAFPGRAAPVHARTQDREDVKMRGWQLHADGCLPLLNLFLCSFEKLVHLCRAALGLFLHLSQVGQET